MSSFSICKVCSGSVLLYHILAHVWQAGLPNQMLGKVAIFLMRPAWLVTSFMLSVCVQREAAHVGNNKKTKPVATEIHLERLRHSSCLIHPLPFSRHDLNPSPCTTILDYASRPFIRFEKNLYCSRRAPRQYSPDMEISPLPSGPFCPGSLTWRSKIQSLFLGKFFHVMSPNYPKENFQYETISQVKLHFFSW